jgi:hypothetical protein
VKRKPPTKTAIASLDEKAETIRELVAAGKTLRETGEAVGVSKQRVSDWLSKPENAEWYKGIKRSLAQIKADQGEELVMAATPETISVVREQARYLQWIAEAYDRETYGKGPSVALQINVADAFVRAFRDE